MSISNERRQFLNSPRGGATVLAVLVVLTITCLMAHQTVRTLYLLRQGQTASAKLAQAREVLELGQILEYRYRRGDTAPLLAGPILVKLGQEYARLEFSTGQQPAGLETDSDPLRTGDESQPDAIVANDKSESRPIAQIKASWPVASNGADLSDQIPNVVTCEIHDGSIVK